MAPTRIAVKPMGITYQVVIQGVNDDFSKKQVISNLAVLLETTEDKLAHIFATPAYVVKQGLYLDAATKYLGEIENCGCVCFIEPENHHANAATSEIDDIQPVLTIKEPTDEEKLDAIRRMAKEEAADIKAKLEAPDKRALEQNHKSTSAIHPNRVLVINGPNIKAMPHVDKNRAKEEFAPKDKKSPFVTQQINLKLMLGIIGSIILFLGVFAPIVSVPIMGNMNYFQNGKGDGTIVLLLAVASLIFVLLRNFKALWFTGFGSLGLLLFTFINFQIKMSEVKSDMESKLVGNPFRGLADMAMQSVQLCGFNRSTQQIGEIVGRVFRSLVFSLGAHLIFSPRH